MSRRAARSGISEEDHAVYAAEDTVDADIGPDLRRWQDLVNWTAAVLDDDRVRDRFTTLPDDIRIGRRSRNASASMASADEQTILIRDGSRSALVVLHELSHLISPCDPPHDTAFRTTLVELVRLTCGIEAAAALAHAYRAGGLDA